MTVGAGLPQPASRPVNANSAAVEALSFHSGFAVVSNGASYGFLDTSGKMAIAMIYENAGMFSEGLAAVNKNGKWGYIDKTGKEIIGMKYNFAGAFDNGAARVMIAGKWILIDPTGKKIADSE